jgi:hypothetical protein
VKRGLLAVAVVVLVGGSAVGLAEALVKPGPLEQLRAERINANGDAGGPIAMLWSVESYSDIVYAQGPRGAAAPTQIRIISPDGGVMEPRPTRTLDPAVNTGVCPNERPPLGTTWWSGAVPHEMAEQLRSSGQTAWRIEAYGRMGWVPVVLIDSGCRGIGRG